MNKKLGLILSGGAAVTIFAIVSWPPSPRTSQEAGGGIVSMTPALGARNPNPSPSDGLTNIGQDILETREDTLRSSPQDGTHVRRIAAVTGETRATNTAGGSEPVERAATKTFSTGADAITIELDRGVRLPLALVKTDKALYPGQIDAREKIRRDFESEIAGAVRQPNAGKVNIDEIWNDARQRADERFRLLFGDEAYNQASVQAAREALSPSGQ